jgi:hypothetical protein
MPAPRDGYHASEYRCVKKGESFYTADDATLYHNHIMNEVAHPRWIAVPDAKPKPVVRYWRVNNIKAYAKTVDGVFKEVFPENAFEPDIVGRHVQLSEGGWISITATEYLAATAAPANQQHGIFAHYPLPWRYDNWTRNVVDAHGAIVCHNGDSVFGEDDVGETIVRVMNALRDRADWPNKAAPAKRIEPLSTLADTGMVEVIRKINELIEWANDSQQRVVGGKGEG